ncbi:MAG: hypothetical protein HY673_18265 [Chloroflexi bacterium]|nr:hypothetical protein [Chloroflexota bacterium]
MNRQEDADGGGDDRWGRELPLKFGEKKKTEKLVGFVSGQDLTWQWISEECRRISGGARNEVERQCVEWLYRFLDYERYPPKGLTEIAIAEDGMSSGKKLFGRLERIVAKNQWDLEL